MRRGKEESRDYRVNFKFTEACDKAIKRYSCDTEGLTAGSFTHTTSILQCLNNHVDNGMSIVSSVLYACVLSIIYCHINYKNDKRGCSGY